MYDGMQMLQVSNNLHSLDVPLRSMMCPVQMHAYDADKREGRHEWLPADSDVQKTLAKVAQTLATAAQTLVTAAQLPYLSTLMCHEGL